VGSSTGNRPVGTGTQRVFFAVVLAQIGIVLTGGLVRLTGSGLGCPTWPQCAPGSYTPTFEQAEGWHSVIEFGNRLLTFVVGFVVLAGVVAAWRHRPRRPALVALAVVQLLGVLGQAVLGGITVLTGLHPATVAAHFLLSMLLIGFAVVLYRRAREGDAPPQRLVRREVQHLGTTLLVVAALVLAVGTVVTGSGPHSGDAEEPARFGLDPRTVGWVHADLVFLFLGLTVAMMLALRLTDGPRTARRRAAQLLTVILAQGAVGYVQYFTGLPIALVAVHMLGACLVVVTTVGLVLALRERPTAADRAASVDELARTAPETVSVKGQAH
jgi:cytochrome c oxidase assembly protein subunit 15